jgi:putative transposase
VKERSVDLQPELSFRAWGGRRRGAGRPRNPRHARGGGVPHSARPKLCARTPVHVTVKLRRGMPSVRSLVAFARVRAVLCSAASTDFQVVQWSVQVDHVHLVVEADDERALSRGMARFDGALARAVNGVAGRKGSALRERYHARALRTPREVHHALRYVMNNGHKHRVVAHGVDSMSSGAMFDGWAETSVRPLALDASVRSPRTWLLCVGWRRHGLIRFG